MKKALLVFTALASLNALAVEFQLKGGYDAFRRAAKVDEFFSSDESKRDLDKGFVLNAELFPIDQYKVEAGLGIEYNFSNTSTGYGFANVDSNKREFYHIPLYGILKANVLKFEDGNAPLAIVGKLGYAYVKENNSTEEANQINTNKFPGGLYYALGFNSEYGPFVVEALASRTHLGENVISADENTAKPTTKSESTVINKVGITAGVRLGQGHEREVAKVEPKPVVIEQPKVEAPKPVIEVKIPEVKPEPKPEPAPAPAPKPAPVVVEGKLPLHCSTDARECVIHGFAVDGREPNNDEIDSIKKIVEVVNKYAVNGVVNVTGHTDSTGSIAYNQKLSESRAKNVSQLLRKYGLREDIKFGVVNGKGELSPSDTNKTKEGRYQNRRVVLNFDEVLYDKNR